MLCIACVAGLSGCADPYQQETLTEQTAEKFISHNVRTNSLFSLQVESNKIEVKYENALQMWLFYDRCYCSQSH